MRELTWQVELFASPSCGSCGDRRENHLERLGSASPCRSGNDRLHTRKRRRPCTQQTAKRRTSSARSDYQNRRKELHTNLDEGHVKQIWLETELVCASHTRGACANDENSSPSRLSRLFRRETRHSGRKGCRVLKDVETVQMVGECRGRNQRRKKRDTKRGTGSENIEERFGCWVREVGLGIRTKVAWVGGEASVSYRWIFRACLSMRSEADSVEVGSARGCSWRRVRILRVAPGIVGSSVEATWRTSLDGTFDSRPRPSSRSGEIVDPE